MKNFKLGPVVALFAVCMLFWATSTSAQKTEIDGSLKVEVTMMNGDVFSGFFIEENEAEIVIQGDSGLFRLQRSKIKSITEIDPEIAFSFGNPNPTRYFFSPSAIGIKKNEGYYQNLLLVGNFVNYGISEHFSIGGGFEFISLMLGEPIVFITPKISTQVGDKTHVAGGVFLGDGPEIDLFGIGYGSFTYGTNESNVTTSLGYGFADGTFSKNPVVGISGMHRVTNTIALIGENYLLPDDRDIFYIGNYGVRFIGRKNAFDLGFIIVEELVSFIPALPFVGYVRQF